MGNSRLIRTSFFWFVFIPILARFLQHFPESIEINLFGVDAPVLVPLRLPFRWTIFYFMSVAFAFAQAIYLWQCPSLIRRYANFSEYQKRHAGVASLANTLQLTFQGHSESSLVDAVRGIDPKLGTAIAASQRQRGPLLFGSEQLVTALRDVDTAVLNDVFDLLITLHSREFPRILLLCSGLFAIGGALFATLCAQGFWSVLKAM